MSISVLIIGFGSIGRRHAKILSTFREVKNIFVLTSQNDIHYDKISKIEQILILDVDYIIIASNTALHFKYLKFLEDNLKIYTMCFSSYLLIQESLMLFDLTLRYILCCQVSSFHYFLSHK